MSDLQYRVSVLSEIWPVMERCTVISKKEIFYLWPFGLASWLWGTIFIDRLNVKSAQNTINKTGETIRQKKVIVILEYYNFLSAHFRFFLKTDGFLFSFVSRQPFNIKVDY